MSARRAIARLLIDHEPDWDTGHCLCGHRFPLGALSDWSADWAAHLAEELLDPSLGLICPAPLAHAQVRR